MEFEVFCDALNQIVEKTKEGNGDISIVDIVADNYYDCLQFADADGNLLAEIDFTESGAVSFYGQLR
ncbi:hypothetical protein [Peptostreptococcus anaerobius]|uniref:hypothetical protein n=1 Tax=Peptostreptococcus anaerobius TaxID=1261 RepID=UPI003D6E3C4B